jgi:hypothetical protein
MGPDRPMLERSRVRVETSASLPIVATRLSGGLGNQLFQYAAGRCLAHQCGARLVIDTSPFSLPRERRKFGLGLYPIDAEIVADGYCYPPLRPVVKLPRPRRASEHGILDRIIHRVARSSGTAEELIRGVARQLDRVTGGAPSLRVFNERDFDYDVAFASLRGPTYLVGYWQSYKYFEPVHDVVRQEIKLMSPPNQLNSSWLARIKGSNSVSMHVRRTDYLSPDHVDLHGFCSLSYYDRAMTLMKELVENPIFFIFSDDLEWCRSRIVGPEINLVDANGADAPQEELRLMASCRHHVIANSSFSWWGAWLGRHAEQTVVRPDRWFTPRLDTPDLFPSAWIALPRN